MSEPDLDRLDKLVDSGLPGPVRTTPRARRDAEGGSSRPVPVASPEWTKTLVGLLERLLERLDRVEGHVSDVGRRVDTGANKVVGEVGRALQPLLRSNDEIAVLNGQVADLAGQVRELRTEVAALTEGLAELGVGRPSPARDESA